MESKCVFIGDGGMELNYAYIGDNCVGKTVLLKSIIDNIDKIHEKNEFKIVIVGDGGVGKSVLLKRIDQGVFEKEYIPTTGVEVHSLTRETNYGNVTLNFWDTAGQEKCGDLRDGYYIKSDACIMMFDSFTKTSFENLINWVSDVKRVCENIPFIFCRNKCDKNEKMDENIILSNFDKITKLFGIKNYDYIETSARNNTNTEKLIKLVIKSVFKKDNLIISPNKYSNAISNENVNFPVEIEYDDKLNKKEFKVSKNFENLFIDNEYYNDNLPKQDFDIPKNFKNEYYENNFHKETEVFSDFVKPDTSFEFNLK